MVDHRLADTICDVTELVLYRHGPLHPQAIHKWLVSLHIITPDEVAFEALSSYLGSDARFASQNEAGHQMWSLSARPV